MQPDHLLAASSDKAKDLDKIGPSGWAIWVVPKLVKGGGETGLGHGILNGRMTNIIFGLDGQEGPIAAGLFLPNGADD